MNGLGTPYNRVKDEPDLHEMIQRKIIIVNLHVELLDEEISYTRTGQIMDELESIIGKINIKGAIPYRPNMSVRYDYFEPLDHK